MAPLYDGHDYYKKMFELQEKLRKSEEERIRLEERFNVLVRQSRNRHDTCINRLRVRYIQYLEEQRTRDERNHRLLSALDKVANKLALISAKRDRLNVLRKQYEAYLVRVYANRRPPGSITGDSGIASQNEDRCPRKPVVAAQPDLGAAETRGVSSPRVHRASLQSSQPRSTAASKRHDHSPVNSTLLNNPAALPNTPVDAPAGVDYDRTSVLRGPHIYVSPIGRSAIDQRAISGYEGSPSGNHQDAPSLRAPYKAASVLSTVSTDQTRSNAEPVNPFFREHVELMQTAPGLSTTAGFPAEAAAPNETGHSYASRQFDPLTLAQRFQYHDANVLLASPESRIRERILSDADATRPASTIAKSSDAYPATIRPEINVVDQIEPLPGYTDYTLRSPQKSEDEGSTRSLTSDDVDDLIRRNEHLLWRNVVDVAKTPRRPPTALGTGNANLDENGRTTVMLENELDRYINNIRKLHREHGVPSQDEPDHEQNTSGDLLNVTLSEDAAELPVEDRVRRERMPEEMDRILALASDLAARTADPRGVAGNDSDDAPPAEVGDEIRHRADRNDTSEVDGRGDALAKEEAEGRGVSTTDEIREDVATHSPELEKPRVDASLAKENRNNVNDSAGTRERDVVTSAAKRDDARGEITASLTERLSVDDPRNVSEEEQLDVVTGEISDIEGMFDTAGELAPWDLASMQKKVRELHLDDPDAVGKETEGSVETRIGGEVTSESSDPLQDRLPPSQAEARKSDANEAEYHERNETRARVEKVEPSEISDGDRHQERKADEPVDVAPRTDEGLDERDENSSEKRNDNDEMLDPRVDDQPGSVERDNEHGIEQGYIEDPSQAQQYEQQDPNEQYHYDQSVPYESAANEEYGGYAGQGYAQEGQEYVEYVDGQYVQYVGDPNDQQYQGDPNAQYEQDPNQAYGYGYDQQYDPDQGYAGDPNQAYGYAESVPYDPDQTYQQGYDEEQRNPEGSAVDAVNVEVEPETKVTSSHGQVDPKAEREEEGDEERSQRVESVNGTGQSKRKDVIKSLLDSDTDTTTIERNISNTESDFDFN